MREIIQNYVDNKTFMGAVLVAEQDTVLLSQGYGNADLEWAIPNSPATKFRIGSITKQFTAACILLLQERGQLKLEDPIKKYLPNAPESWDKVTLYMLLTHTAGIPNYTGLPAWDAFKLRDHTPQEILALFSNLPPDFEPGAKFFYSNSGYILLGLVIEKVSGMPYSDFLQENILAPLEMTETGTDHNRFILLKRAQGYNSGANGFMHAEDVPMTLPYAAGCLYSTVSDLLKWERALFAGKVLSPPSLQMMTTPKSGEYGMGLFIKDAAHHGVVTHNGTIDGFDASLNYYPDKQLTIVVLGNVQTSAPDKIAEQLGKVAYGEKVIVNSDRRVIRVEPGVLAEYAGHYAAPPFSTTLSVEGDTLIATAPNGKKYVLIPESETNFFLKEIDVQIEFLRAPTTKKVSSFIMTQEGKQTNVQRR
jgi:CubicO group peptidase (beta-lactamase class C family)